MSATRSWRFIYPIHQRTVPLLDYVTDAHRVSLRIPVIVNIYSGLPVINASVNDYGHVPLETVADGGYASHNNVAQRRGTGVNRVVVVGKFDNQAPLEQILQAELAIFDNGHNVLLATAAPVDIIIKRWIR